MKRLIRKAVLVAAAVMGMSSGVLAQQPVNIVPFGSDWDYLFTADDDGNPVDPFDASAGFTDWAQPGYRTVLPVGSLRWQRGAPAPFGYGSVDNMDFTAGTALPRPSITRGDTTQYFRHEFTTATTHDLLTFGLQVDDGAVIYLDGDEVARVACCRTTTATHDDIGDPVDYRFRSIGGNGPTGVEGEVFNVAPGLLVDTELSAGDHVIAVEVHQNSTIADDMGFDLRFFQNVENEWSGNPAGNRGSFSGAWSDAANWAARFIPQGAGAAAELGGRPSRDVTAYTDSTSPVTMGSLTVDTSRKYVLAGLGVFEFDTPDGNSSIEVLDGDLEFQAEVELNGNLDITVTGGASLAFKNVVDGNGNALLTTGNVSFNDVTDANIVAMAGAMSSSGEVGGDLQNDGAVVSPGDGIGLMTVVGDFSQGPDGVLAIELGGTQPVADYDVLDVDGQAAFGGTLNVTLLDSFEPALGDVFDIASFSSAVGAFDQVQLPVLADGLAWDVSGLYQAGDISVVPEPASLMLLVLGSLLVLRRRRG